MVYGNIQGEKYPGYGRCIYCGGDGDGKTLRSEHVIPFSMGGETEILEANCVSCQDAINPIDTHLAKKVFYEFRIHANVPTRNPKDRPTTLPARFTIDNKDIELELPIRDHPFTLGMPIWGEPGFFRSARIDEPFPEPVFHLYHYLPSNMHETLNVPMNYPYKIWSSGEADRFLFARAIAKIAYCHTVINYGLDGFRPLAIPDIILGRFSGISYFIGSPMKIPTPASPKGRRHHIEFYELQSIPNHPVSISGLLNLIVARVRLFADSASGNHGLPAYDVITGVKACPKVDSRRPVLKTPKTIQLCALR